MKVIFLDFDGVLNSIDYQMAHWTASDRERLIDPSRLPLLREIIDGSGAVIVLSTSWRKDWVAMDEMGQVIEAIFREFDLPIHDATPAIGLRRDEVAAWLAEHPAVSHYVILDDIEREFWGDLAPHVVVTNPEGEGLESIHVVQALQILNG